VQICKGND